MFPQRQPKISSPTSAIIAAFYSAPKEAVFDQKTVSLVIGFSTEWLERKRHFGGGIPFLKMGVSVRYRKSDVMAWLNQFQTQGSTAETPTTTNPDTSMPLKKRGRPKKQVFLATNNQPEPEKAA